MKKKFIALMLLSSCVYSAQSTDRQRYRAESVDHVASPIYQPPINLQIANALQIRNMKPQIVQLMEDGKLQEAYNLTNQGLSRAPEDGEFIVLKGQILRKAKQYQDALVWFRKCARMRCMEGINYAIDATIKEMNENSTSSE